MASMETMTSPAMRSPRSGQVTRKDVALQAGVSTAVVSYVVNGGPKKVAPATELRVREAIQDLGYRPNAAARALKLGSSETLGLIMPDNTNPFFSLFAHAVEDAAAALGFALVLSNSDGNLTKERDNIRNLAARQVDGVLLASVLFEPDLAALETAEIPSVLLNQDRQAKGFNSVGVDLAAGARLAVEHLIGHGHTHVGLIMGTNVSGAQDGREDGWRDALRDAGLAEGPVIYSEFTRAGGYLAGQRFLELADRPTAIFASSDMQAIGLIRALHEGGLQVPKDVSMVSFDGVVDAEFSFPPLTTVEQPIVAMAEAAVAALVGATKGEPLQHRLLPTQLRVRQSCGCP